MVAMILVSYLLHGSWLLLSPDQEASQLILGCWTSRKPFGTLFLFLNCVYTAFFKISLHLGLDAAVQYHFLSSSLCHYKWGAFAQLWDKWVLSPEQALLPFNTTLVITNLRSVYMSCGYVYTHLKTILCWVCIFRWGLCTQSVCCNNNSTIIEEETETVWSDSDQDKATISHTISNWYKTTSKLSR